MASISSATFHQQLADSPHLKKLQDQMGQIVANTVQEISRDTQDRMQGDPTTAQLSSGIFYCMAYFERLKRLAQVNKSAEARLQSLITRNSFWNSHPPAGFRLVSRYHIQIIPGTLPSDALEGIVKAKNFALMDCAMVCQVGQYQALYEVLGKEKFNKLFSHKTGSALAISHYDKKENPLILFLHFIIPQPRGRGHRDILVGQHACFDNIKGYFVRNRLGEASFYHVVCLKETAGAQTFVGHGLRPTGMSEEEIDQLMVDEYNKLPIPPDMLTDECAKQNNIDKGIEEAKCKLLASPTKYNELELISHLTKKTDPLTAKTAAEQLMRHAQSAPPTLESARLQQLGFSEANNIIDLRTDLINYLAKIPLRKISMQDVHNFILSK